MRTEEIDHIRQEAQRRYKAGLVDVKTYSRVSGLCSRADSADLECRFSRRDRLIGQAEEVLWPDEDMP